MLFTILRSSDFYGYSQSISTTRSNAFARVCLFVSSAFIQITLLSTFLYDCRLHKIYFLLFFAIFIGHLKILPLLSSHILSIFYSFWQNALKSTIFHFFWLFSFHLLFLSFIVFFPLNNNKKKYFRLLFFKRLHSAAFHKERLNPSIFWVVTCQWRHHILTSHVKFFLGFILFVLAEW